MMATVEIVKEDYPETLRLTETSLNVARTPYDKVFAENASVIANVLARIPKGLQAIGPFIERCRAKGWNTNLAFTASAYGVAPILQGQIGRGLKEIDQSIATSEQEGYRAIADWHRLALAEVYLELLAGGEKPPLAHRIHHGRWLASPLGAG